jgi:hypothetical protein
LVAAVEIVRATKQLKKVQKATQKKTQKATQNKK